MGPEPTHTGVPGGVASDTGVWTLWCEQLVPAGCCLPCIRTVPGSLPSTLPSPFSSLLSLSLGAAHTPSSQLYQAAQKPI